MKTILGVLAIIAAPILFAVWIRRRLQLAAKLEAWRPISGQTSNELKVCPKCRYVAVEGEVECSSCGHRPKDDTTWRRAE